MFFEEYLVSMLILIYIFRVDEEDDIYSNNDSLRNVDYRYVEKYKK